MLLKMLLPYTYTLCYDYTISIALNSIMRHRPFTLILICSRQLRWCFSQHQSMYSLHSSYTFISICAKSRCTVVAFLVYHIFSTTQQSQYQPFSNDIKRPSNCYEDQTNKAPPTGSIRRSAKIRERPRGTLYLHCEQHSIQFRR